MTAAGRSPADSRAVPARRGSGPLRGDAAAPLARGWSFAGDPDRMRQGSFADVDADAIVTFAGDAEHARMTGDREVRHLLRRSEFNRDTADELVEELHAGRELVLIDVTTP